MRTIQVYITGLLAIIFTSCSKSDDIILASHVEIVKIWETPKCHAAFTDLIEYNGYLYCTFREGITHAAQNPSEYGTIRLIASQDGTHWENIAVLANPNYDLRDPKLSITPDNKLLILYGALNPDSKNISTQATLLSPSMLSNLTHQSALLNIDLQYSISQPVEAAQTWLWRITWYEGKAYGIAYRDHEEQCRSFLVCSDDGIHYSVIKEIEVPQTSATPAGINEASIEFRSNGDMLVIARSKGTDQGVYAVSPSPYTQWENWKELGITLGGPLIKTIKNNTYIATRGYGTSLYKFNPQTLLLKAVAHSKMWGDTGYPGLVQRSDQLWMSFYHGENTVGESGIYLMKISF